MNLKPLHMLGARSCVLLRENGYANRIRGGWANPPIPLRKRAVRWLR
jgi:hypothetical protein